MAPTPPANFGHPRVAAAFYTASMATRTGGGQQQNRTYYQGDLRHDLLAAALAAIEERGVSALSLRDVARRVGVSHAAPAHHFGDKTGLFTALATEGFHRFADHLAAARGIAGVRPPVRQLADLGVAYVEFAHANPARFDIMFHPDRFDATDDDYRVAAGRAQDILVDAVDRAQAEGWGAGRSSGDMVLLAWAVAHGLASLGVSGSLAAGTTTLETEQMTRLASRVVATLITDYE